MNKVDERIINFISKKHNRTDKFCFCMMYKYGTNELLAVGLNTYENFTTHAEINCIKQLLRKNMLDVEIDIFITKSPCIKCWLVLQNFNIKNIYYIYDYELDFRAYLQPNKSINLYQINEKCINKINNVDIKRKLNIGLLFRDNFVNIKILFICDINMTIEISTTDIIKTIINMWKANCEIRKIIVDNTKNILVNEIIFFKNFNIMCNTL